MTAVGEQVFNSTVGIMAPKNRFAVTYTTLIRGMQFVLLFSIALIVGFSFCSRANEKKFMFISYLHKSVWYSRPTPRQKNFVNATTHLSMAEVNVAPCLPNWAFNNLTANLKPIYKDFMAYRHCRDFPSIHKADMCKGKDIFLLLVIKSLAGNADHRASVRSTWGQERRVDGLSIRRVFLLGRMESQIRSQSVQSLVDRETKVYSDIIQWDFRESFFNVTLKETLFWKWFAKECQDVKFVLKGDDDMFVNVENLVEYLKEFDASQDLYVGDVFRNWYPVRVVSSKYYIPLFLYGKKPYPPYAGGGGYLLSGTSIRKLHNASKFEELFPIDDAFVGICAQRAKIEVVAHQGFRTFGNIPYDPCIYKMLMVIHRVTPNELWLIWRLLDDVTKQCVHSLKV